MSIQVENLMHIYNQGMPNEQMALDNVSFSLEDNKILGVIGHTGSGKSTLMQHLNGLIKATSGKIVVDGVEITNPEVVMKDVRRQVGLVFQYPEYQLFEETVAKDVAYGPMNLGLEEDEIQSRVEEAIELVGLNYEEIKDRSPFELSGGQKRRVAIAGVIAMKPKVLILDEPTAGLDPGAHKDVLTMIENIQKRENNIIIFVSHNMDDVATLSDMVLVMDSGKVYMYDEPRNIFTKKEDLTKVGLELPFPASIASEINEVLGQEKIKKDVLTMKELEESIMDYMIGGESND